MAGLEDTKGVREGNAEAVREEAGSGGYWIQELWHGVVRVVDETGRIRRVTA